MKRQSIRNGIQCLQIVIAAALLCVAMAGCSANSEFEHTHKWKEATCETPRVCKICGETEGAPLGHVWQEATCEAPKTCTVCGKTEGKALGHAWQEATCIAPKTCSVCGKTEGKKNSENHVWGEATCTEREKCVLCGKENLHSEPLGHDWIPATIEKPYTCARCGKQDGEPIAIGAFNRGRSGKWEEHPTKEQYIGMSGYVAVTHSSYMYPTNNSPYKNDWLSEPWYATTYEKDKQFFNPVGTVEHKTPVTVIGQELTDWQSGACCYDGFLLVERADNGEQFYISVTDFVTEPYWETTSATDIGATNPCLAVYHQRSDYYPVDRNGKKYNAADGEVVMIFGTTNWGGIDEETNQVDVLGANGRGFFNTEDLTVIY